MGSNKRLDLSGFKTFIKKPIPVKAKQMSEPFVVHTLEGVMEGKKGDYLVIGVDGEPYPCDGQIFRKTYYEVGDKDGVSGAAAESQQN